jgi:hypothetical protein
MQILELLRSPCSHLVVMFLFSLERCFARFRRLLDGIPKG